MGILRNIYSKIKSITNNMDKKSEITKAKMEKNPMMVSQTEFLRFKSQQKLSEIYKKRVEKKLSEAQKIYDEKIANLEKEKGYILTNKDYEYQVKLAEYKLNKVKYNLGVLKDEPIKPESEMMTNIKVMPNKVKETAIETKDKVKETAIETKDKVKETAIEIKDKVKSTPKKVLKSTTHALSELVINSYAEGIYVKKVITGYKKPKEILKMLVKKAKDFKNNIGNGLSKINEEAHRRSEEKYNEKRKDFISSLKVDSQDMQTKVNTNDVNQKEKQDKDMER